MQIEKLTPAISLSLKEELHANGEASTSHKLKLKGGATCK